MLRRMAIQSADYDREQRAFKGEMRSRRWKIDKFLSDMFDIAYRDMFDTVPVALTFMPAS